LDDDLATETPESETDEWSFGDLKLPPLSEKQTTVTYAPRPWLAVPKGALPSELGITRLIPMLKSNK